MSEHLYPMIGYGRLRMEIDGDGVTTLVTSKHCTLRCKYCINPQCFTDGAIEKKYTVSELIDFLRVDDLYFKATNGGVVFGGGEPLLQADFIREFAEARPKEWRILLETALNVPTELLEKVLPYVSNYIVDIKDMNPEIYERYTGKSIDATLVNLNRLMEAVGPERVLIRIPLIPEFNTKEDCERSEAYLRELGWTNFDRFTYLTDRGQKKLEKYTNNPS